MKAKTFKIVDFANKEHLRFEYTITLERVRKIDTVKTMWFKSCTETEYTIHINGIKYIGSERFESSMTYKQVADDIANHIERYLHWTDKNLEIVYKHRRSKYAMFGFIHKYREIEELK